MGNLESYDYVAFGHQYYSKWEHIATEKNDRRFGEVAFFRTDDPDSQQAMVKIVDTIPAAFPLFTELAERRGHLCHANLLALLKYPDIFKVNEDLPLSATPKVAFSFAFQFWDTDLAKVMESRKDKGTYFTEQEIKELMQQVVGALAYMQDMGLPHGFIIPESILYAKDTIKLAPQAMLQGPFHLIDRVRAGEKLPYAPPEDLEPITSLTSSLFHRNPYQADVFSLGVVILQAALLDKYKNPYEWTKSGASINRMAFELNLEEFSKRYSRRLSEILRRMTSFDSKARPDPKNLGATLEQNRLQIIRLSPDKIQHNPQQCAVHIPRAELQEPGPSYGHHHLPGLTPGIPLQSGIYPRTTYRQGQPVLHSSPILSNGGYPIRAVSPPRIIQNVAPASQQTAGTTLITPGQDRVGNILSGKLPASYIRQGISPFQYSNIPLSQRSVFDQSQQFVGVSYNPEMSITAQVSPIKAPEPAGLPPVNSVEKSFTGAQPATVSNQTVQQTQPPAPGEGSLIEGLQTRTKESLKLLCSSLGIPLNEVETELYTDGSRYEGQIKGGLRHGRGRIYFQSGGRYEGDWINGKIQGHGQLYTPDGRLAYDGQWTDEKFHGKGHLWADSADLDEAASVNYRDFSNLEAILCEYEGFFTSDAKDGFGVCKFLDGSRFEGNFKEDRIEGYGKFVGPLSDNEANRLIVHGQWIGSKLTQVLDAPAQTGNNP
jgi:serine/threonine protein kinase